MRSGSAKATAACESRSIAERYAEPFQPARAKRFPQMIPKAYDAMSGSTALVMRFEHRCLR